MRGFARAWTRRFGVCSVHLSSSLWQLRESVPVGFADHVAYACADGLSNRTANKHADATTHICHTCAIRKPHSSAFAESSNSSPNLVGTIFNGTHKCALVPKPYNCSSDPGTNRIPHPSTDHCESHGATDNRGTDVCYILWHGPGSVVVSVLRQ